MKAQISRQTLYLLFLSLFLLVVVLVVSFAVLIPEGKEYRMMRLEKNRHGAVLTQYQQWHDETFTRLKELQSENKRIITAFESGFDAERFVKENSGYFESLQLAQLSEVENDETYAVYEVNATSKIDSPQSFYSFLEAVNKSDWIIGVNFPIYFVRDNSLIRSSFTMRVHRLGGKEG